MTFSFSCLSHYDPRFVKGEGGGGGGNSPQTFWWGGWGAVLDLKRLPQLALNNTFETLYSVVNPCFGIAWFEHQFPSVRDKDFNRSKTYKKLKVPYILKLE